MPGGEVECGVVLKMWARARIDGPGYYWCNNHRGTEHGCRETGLRWSDEDARLWAAMGAQTGEEAAAVFAAL